MSSVSLSEILQARLTAQDLDFEIDDDDFLGEFEDAWSNFLRENPHLLATTSRVGRIASLQEDLNAAETSRDSVEEELHKQLSFFQTSCESLEDEYAGKMQEAIDKQQRLQDEMQKRLDIVSMADHLQQQTLPWHYFTHELDQMSATVIGEADTGGPAGTNSNRATRPSRRAMVLTDRSQGSPSDIQLRAHRIDHALLETHIKMLTKEVERYDKMQLAQEMAGRFLSEYNVWSILSKSDLSLDASKEESDVTPGMAIVAKDSTLTNLTDNTLCFL